MKTVVLDVVGLTRRLISPESTPFIAGYLEGGATARDIEPAFPALTCTAQSTYTSGRGPGAHGVVGNGWYDGEHGEVRNWHQSSGLVRAERIWARLKREQPGATTFVNGWWSVDGGRGRHTSHPHLSAARAQAWDARPRY